MFKNYYMLGHDKPETTLSSPIEITVEAKVHIYKQSSKFPQSLSPFTGWHSINSLFPQVIS